MAVIRCDKCGFHYDDERYRECPNCGRNDLSDEVTVTLPDAVDEGRALDETVSIEVSIGQDIASDVTVGEYSAWKGNDPVAGWIVCVEGASRGRDYRLFHGWNWIGRSSESGVYIADDRAISRKHCAIVYDDRSGHYYLVNDTGALTYLNGAPCTKPQQLESGDRIRMGESEFVFIPFCTEGRKW